MQPLDTVYLQILKNLCTDSSEPIPLDGVDTAALYRLAEKHCSLPFLLPYFEQQPSFSGIKQQTKQMLLSYYQLEHFTRLTFSLLLAEKIPCFLLKGMSLAANYPVPEYRKLGDLDLYIPEKEAFSRACRILETNGYTEEPEDSDHHVTYRFTFPETGRSFTLELHYRIVGIYQFARANELIDEIFSPDHLKPSFVELYGQTYPVLPPTENVFYMLHHMLKHYLYSGFGSRLLCDFTLYLKQYASEIDFEKIHSWCQESKIFHLYELILGSCHLYFGLSASIDPQIRSSAADCAAFLEQILADGDFGSDTERKIVSRGSYRHAGVRAWFHEGHVQMKLRFSKLHKCVLLWPVFWGITFFCFLSNTYRVRHTTLRQTLADFRADNQKTKLLKIFENNDIP